MPKHVSKIVMVMCALVMPTILASPVRAQSDEKEKPRMYTYVAEWGIQRGDWQDYEKANAATKQIMDKLVSDGTIVEYGSYLNLVHREGEPTHGEWWTATSHANLFKALAALTSTANNPDLAKIFAGRSIRTWSWSAAGTTATPAPLTMFTYSAADSGRRKATPKRSQ
jgi:hypothetical protein